MADRSTMMASLSTGSDAGKGDRQMPCQSPMGRQSRRVSRVAGCWRPGYVPHHDAECVGTGRALILLEQQEQEEARGCLMKRD